VEGAAPGRRASTSAPVSNVPIATCPR
jgi:hypothetical protein